MVVQEEQASIKSLYDDFKKKYYRIMDFVDDCTKEEYQLKIKESAIIGKRILFMVNELELFSKDETIEEIQTSYLKYLYLPALIANLLNSSSSNNRLNTLIEAKAFFSLFFSYILTYQIVNKEKLNKIKELMKNKVLKCDNAFSERERRINSLKDQKQLEAHLKLLEKNCKDNPDIDDTETTREIYMVKIKLCVDQSIENYCKLLEEIKILEYKNTIKPEDKSEKIEKNKVEDNNKMIFLRMDKLNKVFGYGYPSLPTMSQDEYYLYELATNKIVTKYTPPEKEYEEDNEKQEDLKLIKDRKWDEFKDDNRRGSGNRYNHG